MATAVKVEKIGGLVWPELPAVAAVMAGHVVVRGVDAAFVLDKPMRRFSDYAHLLTLFGSAYCVATDRAPDVMKAVFFANSGVLATTAGDFFYLRAIGQKVAQIRARKIAERAIKGGQGGLSEAEKAKVLLEARTKSSAGNLTEAEKTRLLEAARTKSPANTAVKQVNTEILT